MTAMGSSQSSQEQSSSFFFDFERDVSVIKQRRFRHPNAALFHVGFKVVSILVYLFGGFIFSETFLGIYVTLILLISMDFWTVKNVTGRLMVGLRWWNVIDDEGNSHWVFENRYNKQSAGNQTGGDNLSMSSGTNLLSSGFSSDSAQSNAADSTLFWSTLIIYPVIWFFLLLVAIFRLNVQYFMIVTLALVLSSSNMYGYIRCKVGSNDIKSAVTSYVGKQILFNFMSSAASSNQGTVPTKQKLQRHSSLSSSYPTA